PRRGSRRRSPDPSGAAGASRRSGPSGPGLLWASQGSSRASSWGESLAQPEPRRLALGRLRYRPPSQRRPFLRRRTVLEEKVDQRLVGNPQLFSQPLEIGEDSGIQPDRDLLLEPFRVWIGFRLGEVVGLSHRWSLRK